MIGKFRAHRTDSWILARLLIAHGVPEIPASLAQVRSPRERV
jgi:hypothetical protein